MSHCDWCGKFADELWSVAGEYGRTESVCDDCVPKPARCEVSGEKRLCCPVCKSRRYQDASAAYWFSRAGGLFHCERKHLFTVKKMTQEVRRPAKARPRELVSLDVTREQSLLCPVCGSAKHKKVPGDGPWPHSGPVFECSRGHLFELLTFTEHVWIPDD